MILRRGRREMVIFVVSLVPGGGSVLIVCYLPYAD